MFKVPVRGLVETSLLDWDGKVTSVLFLGRCNFRCPFCDNAVLVESPESIPEIPLEEVDRFLQRRKNFIDGIVISGGEPTVYPDLPEFIKHFRDQGFAVKLDTNGSNPDQLKSIMEQKLIDYAAMDLKAPLDERYDNVCGTKVDLDTIKKSVALLMNSAVDYEFRTTVAPTFLDEKDIEDLARSIAGAKKWALQQFVPDHTLEEKLRIIAPYPAEKISKMAEIARRFVPKVIVRGV